MATTSETSKILSAISELKSQIAALEAKMGSLALAPEPSAAKAKAAKKPRNPEAPKRPQSEWSLFVERVRALLKANDYPHGAEVMQFCSQLKEEQDMYKWNDESILASRKLWSAPERKPRAPKSVASASAESDSEKPKADKPKKVLSPEHLAAMAEGRARKAAEKKAAAASSGAPKAEEPASEPASETESTGSSGSKKRGPKKGTKLTEEQKAARKAKMAENKLKRAAKVPLPADSDKEEGEVSEAEESSFHMKLRDRFNPIVVRGKKILWNPENNHCYYREDDDSLGDWAGILNIKDKSITITDAPEPEAE